ncbi:hypothetical protein BDZ45DRAFT_677249 [Acephala macrosclerotiorum]|nr:hypothetical protein BDZ45DRAFT_677249 [Acephala macrosclerotiorum]
MGGGSSRPAASRPKTHAEIERERYLRQQKEKERQERLQQKRLAQQQRDRERKEREEWIQAHPIAYEERKWWNVAWWPLYVLLRDRATWRKELRRRKARAGNPDSGPDPGQIPLKGRVSRHDRVAVEGLGELRRRG